jgi:hypothetical protein
MLSNFTIVERNINCTTVDYWTGFVIQIATGRAMDMILLLLNIVFIGINVAAAFIMYRVKQGQGIIGRQFLDLRGQMQGMADFITKRNHV